MNVRDEETLSTRSVKEALSAQPIFALIGLLCVALHCSAGLFELHLLLQFFLFSPPWG